MGLNGPGQARDIGEILTAASSGAKNPFVAPAHSYSGSGGLPAPVALAKVAPETKESIAFSGASGFLC